MGEKRYAESHEWVSVDGNAATVGISEFAVEQLGDVVYLELPEVGKNLKVGDVIGDIESVKAVSQIYAPVAGEIIEVNSALTDQPELVNQSPLQDGWIIRVRLAATDQLDGLMSREAYDKHVAESG